ncbi:hypothetical protein ACLD02_03375 [Alloalcanivorax sp. C16-2]|uniref:hypothetical protein n=1 Tax=Alloalcanivorax sp. C16-2 TaxID=3390052 RepID=UPI003970A0B1
MKRWLGLTLALALAACDAPQQEPAAPDTPDQGSRQDLAAPATATLSDATGARALDEQHQAWREALAALLEQPDEDTLATAQGAWEGLYRAFNRHWLMLAAGACQHGELDRLNRLDAWPFYPAYVDGLPAWPDSGIVNDPALELTAASLRRQQGATADGEVALGFQPLRLLLAGVPDAPRQAMDFQAGAATPTPTTDGGESVPAVDAPARRRDYLRLAGAQLSRDLNALAKDAPVGAVALRCALGRLDQRLAALQEQHGATDPEAGLYLPARSIEIIDAAQPDAALAQLAAEANGPLRQALEASRPGFQAALGKAVEQGDWAPMHAWLSQDGDQGGDGEEEAGGGISPAAAVRG